MSDEKSTDISDIAKSIAAIVDKVPVYEDAIQPAAKQVGGSLELIARAIHSALKPLEAWIWSVEQLSKFVAEKVGKKLENTPPENIQQPSTRIAVPLLEAVRYTGNDPDLSNMYANLLANSMDSSTADKAHPAFVEMIKSMAADEAKILNFLSSNSLYNAYAILDLRIVNSSNFSFSKLSKSKSFTTFQRNLSVIGNNADCLYPASTPSYIDNLKRMGLIVTQRGMGEVDENFYKEIEKIYVQPFREAIPDADLQTVKGFLHISDLGKVFVAACIKDKNVPVE